ncbi:hypothetical protein BT96DRAFT_16050 [Gymnopus androsaceus JB14]|uniref:Uncharacterized protein n=1 Tax=Gymnopus androsaceus JB14 TaxID=1447944 RepID=A0A6A4IV63_9AGAR|nr:hypothetical protein BT96DRAFT_16050 [Gymnopus androsaceus JB14]
MLKSSKLPLLISLKASRSIGTGILVFLCGIGAKNSGSDTMCWMPLSLPSQVNCVQLSNISELEMKTCSIILDSGIIAIDILQ